MAGGPPAGGHRRVPGHDARRTGQRWSSDDPDRQRATVLTMPRLSVIVFLFVVVPTSAFAQQRPLVTEDPETVGAGRILIEGGFDYAREVDYPVSGLTGNLRRFPLIGISLGIGSVGEVQIDGGLYNHLSITDRRPAPLSHMLVVPGDSTWHVEDMMVGSKVRLISEGTSRPSI